VPADDSNSNVVALEYIAGISLTCWLVIVRWTNVLTSVFVLAPAFSPVRETSCKHLECKRFR
jgi:hypothetical protein